MCRPHPAPNAAAKLWTRICPLPVPLVLVLIPLLPESAYLNRGYTVWFHLASVAYFLTRSAFLRRVLILQGTAICLGWYAAIANDWFVDGIFCHSLYRNSPARSHNTCCEKCRERTEAKGATKCSIRKI